MAKVININNAKAYVLEDNNLAYKIEKGTANVYISKFVDNRPELRVFLRDVKPGDKISGLSEIFDQCEYKIFLVNTTRNAQEEIDELKISIEQTNDILKDEFLSGVELIIKEDDYAQNLIQHYLLVQVQGSRNIYVEKLSNENAKDSIIQNISSALSNVNGNFVAVSTDASDMYFACSKVARALRINYLPYEKLNSTQKFDLNPESFSNISECICKQIKLEDGWQNHYIGNFIGYLKDNNQPIACIFKNNHYYIYSKNSQNPVKINKKNAILLKHNAYVLYRSFPNDKLNYKNIINFIYRSVSIKTVLSILFFGIFLTGLGMIYPVINQFIYDVLIPNSDFVGLLGCACVLISILIGNGIVSLIKGYASLSISSRVKYSLQIALFDRLFKLKQSFIKQFEPADLSMRILGVSSIFTSLTTTTVATVITFLFSFLYLFQMINFMPILSLPAILVVLIIFITLIVFSRLQYKWYNQSTQFNIEKSSFLFQMIRGAVKLRTSGAEDRAINKYIDKHLASSKLNFRIGYYSGLTGILGSLMSGAAIIIFYTIIYLDGLNTSVGSLMGFMSSYGIFSAALLQIPSCYFAYLQAKPWIDRLRKIFDELPEDYSSNKVLESIDGKIDVRHLTFKYDDNSPTVIDNLSFCVEKGEYIGIVGTSGCGKTTLLKLLLGFEHQNNGKIYYDNYDLDEINKQELRRNFGVVLQDGDLISGSIFDNISITKSDATLDDVNEALANVGLLEEVNNMPMGVFTLLSEGSGLISGGQKQRILIARAIINKPKIIFLDEATSALDNVTQSFICNYLKKLPCTKIVIAHRLSTVIDCDKILVVSNGKIAESGNYKELMKQKGLFYKLSQRQI